MRKEDIDIILISGKHLTNKYNFNSPDCVFHKTNHPDGKAHGGTGILVRNRLRQFTSQWVLKRLYTGNVDPKVTISSVYCPPRFTIAIDKFEEFFSSLGIRFLACGDYNAKHI